MDYEKKDIMITEDYVSFETAKLLKEKGFECNTLHHYYDKDGDLLFSAWSIGAGKNECSAPTLQMTMKWLRKKGFNIVIDTQIYEPGMGVIYEYTFKIIHFNFKAGKTDNKSYSSYEEACEAAIKYCLENLI